MIYDKALRERVPLNVTYLNDVHCALKPQNLCNVSHSSTAAAILILIEMNVHWGWAGG